MERTAPRRSLGQRPRETLWTPRALQWNLASALGTVCVALLIAGAAVTLDRAGQPASSLIPAVATTAPSTRVLVRLVMLQPGAQTVGVAGDFNGWDPLQTPLVPTTGGAWTVTLPLEPGRYEYMFVVDGTEWMADPFAEEQQDDGFGLRNGVLDVRSTLARLKVEVNEEKSRTVDLGKGESFGFLGFDFRRVLSRWGRWRPLYTPQRKKCTALLRRLRDIFHRYRAQPVREVVHRINPILRGWVRYFAIGQSSRCFSYVCTWVDMKIQRHWLRTRQRPGFGWRRWRWLRLSRAVGVFLDYDVRPYRPAAGSA